ncbi:MULTISPECIES: substrate-binding domain-containing protein [unclassified Streptomyces]|uniref:substrate-binding domain-containing protein n=1 Tax=unclassified Streptomyces TaxID=2593676 RepID=UPI0016611C31|nr:MULTISPECIES: substrate-binding domain-containing protein [unclassified Streptomyces]MBD0709601.1 ABC transporter substrate-binding protein [Streptomyces sp. CBMA291]MBD0714373.1 ABC transporter substrate-binding protein [Streptomyces sp. CBMA370]
MHAVTHRAVIVTAAVSMSLSLAACGKAGGGDSNDKGSSTKIGLLLPENKTARYEALDKPQFEKAVAAACADCEVVYNNAVSDVVKQKQQFDQLIADGVKVIALDPVDATKAAAWVADAKAKGVRIVAYDRAVAGADAYVSHDNTKVGELQGQALLAALGAKAATAKVVMINGDEKDPNAALFKKGAHSALDGKVGKVVYEASGEWDPKIAGEKMSAAISSVGKSGIGAVYSANDGMAGGVITSLENAGIRDIPVGGQDAEAAGIQRIIAGSQTFTIYKSPLQLAPEAAKFAVNLLKGKEPGAQGATDGVPSTLFPPVVVDRKNIQSTVIKDGIYRASELCTPDLAARCTALGVK